MMFFMVSAVLFIFGFFIHRPEIYANNTDGSMVCFFFATVAFLAGIIATAIGYTEQVSDIEKVEKFKATGEIYKEKAKNLTSEFARYLANDYPKHEREIFEKISPEKVSVYLVQYPELKAAETVTALVKAINRLQSKVYDQRIEAEECLKNIRCRPRNFWIYITPIIPRT
jgi:hypothetical protein